MEHYSLKEHLNNVGATSIFLKAVGRDTKPTWANRFVKDSYDLDYSRQSVQKIIPSFRSPQKHLTINKSPASHNKSTIQNKSQVIHKQRKSIQKLPYLNYKANPQTTINSTTKDVLGLCPFQYQNTIQGRIKKRSSLHLSFSKNKVNRIINQNPIYYNRFQDIDLTNSRLPQQRKAIQMHHPFKSYTKRKTFQPKDELDKIFDTEHAFKAASPRRSPDAILKFDGVLQRKQTKLNQSVDLSYEYMPAIDHLKQKSVSYPIAAHQRQLQIYPQIISDRRGCYR